MPDTAPTKETPEAPKHIAYWPYCAECRQPFFFHPDEPFASCACGTGEWGDPRPFPWVPNPLERKEP